MPSRSRTSTQLGYPSTAEEMSLRIGRILSREEHGLFVAEMEGEVVGWVHVHVPALLESDCVAEVGGLVVDRAHRSRGIGRALMSRAEAWAANWGCETLRLRSRIQRTGAHEFYKRLGYAVTKTSYTFQKQLRTEADDYYDNEQRS